MHIVGETGWHAIEYEGVRGPRIHCEVGKPGVKPRTSGRRGRRGAVAAGGATAVRTLKQELRASYREAAVILTRATASPTGDSIAHTSRIGYYAVELAKALGLPREFREFIHYASPLRDVGNLGIPASVLGKPCDLEGGEAAVMRRHAALGEKLLRGADSPYLSMAAQIAAAHHERWEGGGYPQGLKGDAIPLAARIVSICDQYDALTSPRPYRPAHAHEVAVQIITMGDGRTMPTHFDPGVLSAFKQCQSRFREIAEAHADGITSGPA